jgi:oligosaccharide repeat unit polymerase
MNEITVVITTSLLLLLAIEFYRIYKLRMILHPGFYFMSIWLFAVPSNYYLTLVGYAQDPYPEYVDELNIFVAFTALVFILIIRFGKKSISNHTIILKFGSSLNLYKSIVYITLLSTIIKFILLLITVGISFNLGKNRDIIISAGFRDRSLNLFDYLLSYGMMLYPIITILAGYYLGRKMQKLSSPVQSKLLIALPFIITLIQVLIIGGRNPLALGLKYYLLGLSLSLMHSIQKNITKKILIYCFFIIVVFSSFSNYVGNQRDLSLIHI